MKDDIHIGSFPDICPNEQTHEFFYPPLTFTRMIKYVIQINFAFLNYIVYAVMVQIDDKKNYRSIFCLLHETYVVSFFFFFLFEQIGSGICTGIK